MSLALVCDKKAIAMKKSLYEGLFSVSPVTIIYYMDDCDSEVYSIYLMTGHWKVAWIAGMAGHQDFAQMAQMAVVVVVVVLVDIILWQSLYIETNQSKIPSHPPLFEYDIHISYKTTK